MWQLSNYPSLKYLLVALVQSFRDSDDFPLLAFSKIEVLLVLHQAGLFLFLFHLYLVKNGEANSHKLHLHSILLHLILFFFSALLEFLLLFLLILNQSDAVFVELGHEYFV